MIKWTVELGSSSWIVNRMSKFAIPKVLLNYLIELLLGLLPLIRIQRGPQHIA